MVALDERGLVGRVTETGARTARVLLLTDLNSRIPVILETSRARAILKLAGGAPAMFEVSFEEPLRNGFEVLGRNSHLRGDYILSNMEGPLVRLEHLTGDPERRARFAGLDRDEAEAVCKKLKRSDISCFTIKN